MKRNLTIQLDDKTIKDAKIIAARRFMSISGLVSEEIRKVVVRESNYEKTKKSAIERLMQGYNLGGGTVTKRDEIYKR